MDRESKIHDDQAWHYGYGSSDPVWPYAMCSMEGARVQDVLPFVAATPLSRRLASSPVLFAVHDLCMTDRRDRGMDGRTVEDVRSQG